MKTICRLLVWTLGVMPLSVFSQDFLTVQNAVVTDVKVYERQDNSTLVWILLNGNNTVGPNPANTSNQCELWTKTDAVYTAALSAMVTGSKVTVQYIDRGEGTYWCTVRSLTVSAGL